MSHNREHYVIKVYKNYAPHVRNIPTYFARTVLLNEKSFNEMTDPLGASQVTLEALAFYVNKGRNKLSGSGDMVHYEMIFPQDVSFRGDKGALSKVSGLSLEEIDRYFTALNDVNNPDPHK